MPTYRTFQNTDPPALTAIWRSRAGQRGLLQPISVERFEQSIFGKIHFDSKGTPVYYDGGVPHRMLSGKVTLGTSQASRSVDLEYPSGRITVQ